MNTINKIAICKD